jgi:hypothetical protein
MVSSYCVRSGTKRFKLPARRPFDAIDRRDRDLGTRQSHALQIVHQQSPQAVELDVPIAVDVDVGAIGRLSHLVLDDVALLSQTRAKDVRMHRGAIRVLEHVVQPPSMSATSRCADPQGHALRAA